jgi:hypothetical protein
MMGLLLNMANVCVESRVLIVENTRGLISGALLERGIEYGLRVEFGSCIKINSEILNHYGHSATTCLKLGSISGKLLLNQDDHPLNKALVAQYKRKFNSYIFVHDTVHPLEVYKALKTFI